MRGDLDLIMMRCARSLFLLLYLTGHIGPVPENFCEPVFLIPAVSHLWESPENESSLSDHMQLDIFSIRSHFDFSKQNSHPQFVTCTRKLCSFSSGIDTRVPTRDSTDGLGGASARADVSSAGIPRVSRNFSATISDRWAGPARLRPRFFLFVQFGFCEC